MPVTRAAFRASLVDRGLRPEEAERKAALLDQALAALAFHVPGITTGSLHVTWAPGRVEVLGKHTDYAGGRSLVCAAERGIVAVSVSRPDRRLVVVDAATGTVVDTDIVGHASVTAPPWGTYVAAVSRRVARNFPSAVAGATVALASDLPQAAGLSSSSALVVAVFLAVAGVTRIESSPEYVDAIRGEEELAAYLATIENGAGFGRLVGDRGVGTAGGSEDHTAMLCGRAGRLSQFSFCPVRREADLPLAEDLRLAIASSGVVAEKAGAAREAYNRASLAAARVLDRWNRATARTDPSLGHACVAAGADPDRLRDAVALEGDDPGFPVALLLDRLEQFREESLAIVPAASAALAAGDLASFGAAVSRSQELAEQRLGNQVPETAYLARSALRLGGAAASAFGAGFGGSVWALVARDRVSVFLEEWRRDYVARFPSRSERCAFFDTRPGPPAMRF